MPETKERMDRRNQTESKGIDRQTDGEREKKIDRTKVTEWIDERDGKR